MRRLSTLTVAVTGWLVAAAAAATTLEGTVTYGDLPLGDTFPGLTHGVAAAYDNSTDQWVYGTADPATGTYRIDGLTNRQWFVRVLFGNRESTSLLPMSGDVTGYDTVTVTDQQTITLDLEGWLAYHVLQPLDSTHTWQGSITQCPLGPGIASTFTLAWDSVPRAARYRVTVQHLSCDGLLSQDQIETESLSVAVHQGTAPGETQLSIQLSAFSETGRALTVAPAIQYENGSAQGILVHPSGDSGRAVHPAGSVFVTQVAHLPGVAPSFWTSDLILTNPTASDVAVTLTYTPRDADGLSDYDTATVTVPAGSCRVVADVVDSLFHQTGAGSLEVLPSTVRVDSRIATPASGGGTYGQGFPAVSPDEAASLTGPVTTLGAGGVAKGVFRSNLVLTEVWGESVTAEVELLDRDGASLGTSTIALQPFSTTQINDIVGQVAGLGSLSEGQVVVTVTAGSGRLAGALSMVDGTSQDPTTIALQPR